ncbi:MAG: glycosyltransferase [Eubacteriales bacterium]|nr:glycosyltransferase [Eubacteriales bacterium]
MKAVFLSNYINHHQIPFSRAMYERLGEGYHFIQTQEMERERVQMGWAGDFSALPYVVYADREEERCRALMEEADLVLAGWTERTDLFLPRLSSGKLTLRLSERIYREGQWRAVSPRGLLAKYREHVRFRRNPVWLLCCGAYVASDFSLIGAYPGKMLQFGYFPELRTYGREELFAKKDRERLQIVWAGRMIPLKHPEFAVRLAEELRREGHRFLLHMVGGGPLEEQIREQVRRAGLEECTVFYGFQPPERVRDVMERCQLCLFTSNYLEGWGAVVSEAMNSGCCVAANAQAGAVPFLIRDGENGLVYENGSYEALSEKVRALLAGPEPMERMERMGYAAYRTIAGEWNADCAAQRCLEFYGGWREGAVRLPESGPLAPAPVLPARWKYDEGRLE